MRVQNPGGAGRSDHHGHVPHQAVSADQVADLRAAMDWGTATLPKLTALQFSLDASGLMVPGGFEPGCKGVETLLPPPVGNWVMPWGHAGNLKKGR